MKETEILFVTSTNLSTNPRCYKEMKLAVDNGYKVSLLAFDLPGWSRNFEPQLAETLGDVDFYYLPAGREPFLNWFMSSVAESAARFFFGLGIKTHSSVAIATSKRVVLLNKFLKRYKGKPQLVIAHNPPAFYPVQRFAQSTKTKYAIDVEDYHPGEGNDEQLKRITIDLIKNILPGASYNSFASPMIQKKTLDLLEKNANASSTGILINNVFPSDNFFLDPETDTDRSGKVKFVWFSQNIGTDRGLELLFPAMDQFADSIELTLIGNPIQEFVDEWTTPRSYIKILPSMLATDLYRSLSKYDIGLSIELEKEENRKYCLVNKIWAYYQSGLFIMATNTLAQKQFLEERAGHGVTCSPEAKSYAESISWIKDHIVSIRTEKQKRFYSARNASWENEGIKLHSKWKEILGN